MTGKFRHILIAVVLMAAVGMVPMWSAGGQGEAAGTGGAKLTPPGTLPIVEEMVTISAFVAQSSWISDMIDNESTKELEKRTNVHLDLQVVLDEAAAEKKSLLLASGDYPEIFFSGGFNKEDQLLYGMEQGIFQPVNDLIESQGVNVKKVFAHYPELRAGLTAPDGNIYGLPHINECFHCTYSQKMWYNQKWLDNLGLDVPTTTEEFYQVLLAIKENDVNGNGDPNDEIPLMGSIKSWHNPVYDYLMNAFIYNDGASYFDVRNDKLVFVPGEAEWRDGLRYMNKLYGDGLIYPASFTQNREQAQTIGDNPGDALFFAGTAGHIGMYMKIGDEDPYRRHRDYGLLAPLKGPDGVQWSAIYRDFASSLNFVITDKAQYPEVAFRIADYMYSKEGTALMELGPWGHMYVLAEEGELGLTGEQAFYKDIRDQKGHSTVHNFNWGQQATTVRTAEFRASGAVPQEDPLSAAGYELRLFRDTAEKMVPYAPEQWFINVFVDPDDVEEMAQMKTNILDYIRQSAVQFIIGELDIDSDWDSYLAQLKRLNLDKYVLLNQDAWDSMK